MKSSGLTASRGATGITATVASVSAMEYIKQLRALSAFSQVFDFKADSVRVDNIVFRLHSMVTVFILMVGTMFVTMRQYFGDPIECLTTKTDVSPTLLQHYCWLESTFSVVSAAKKSPYQGYYGSGPLNPHQGDTSNHHRYYQWVYFVLILQAIMFYVPKYLWKAKEAKRLRVLISELRGRHIREHTEYDRHRLSQDLADILSISNEFFHFFIFCELFYFVHLVFQIWFTNMFLGGHFLNLGFEWLAYSNTDEYVDKNNDPLVRTFPRLAKCSFRRYGPSGTVETQDALCFLPLNIVNEKIYVILWFWFAFLFIFTLMYLVYRILLILLPFLRHWRITSIAPSTDRKHLKRLIHKPGDWFILNFVANNMKPSHFRDLIDELMLKHYDTDGKPLYDSTAGDNGIPNGANASTISKHSSHKNHKSHKNKNNGNALETATFTAPPLPGFNVNNQPYGNAVVDWAAYSTVLNAGPQINLAVGSSESDT